MLAAASLGEAFDEAGAGFQRDHPGVRIETSYAGSQTLVTQVLEGIAADVVATASPEHMRRIASEVEPALGLATNRLVWIMRPDLDGEPFANGRATRLALAAPEVPAGAYAREALERAGLLERMERATVSNELDVKGVVSKVLFGAADAGLVYATDVTPDVAPRVRTLELPPEAQVAAEYRIAVLRASRRGELAHAFVAYVRDGDGRSALERRGFGPPP